MRDELHLMELVDRYLDGVLDAAGATEFSARLSGSAELRLLVDDQRALREGLQRLPVRTAIMQAHRSWSWAKWGPQFGGAVVVAGLITGGVWYAQRTGHTEHEASPPQEQLAPLPVDSAQADSVHVDSVLIFGPPVKEAGDTTVIHQNEGVDAVRQHRADTILVLAPSGKKMRFVKDASGPGRDGSTSAPPDPAAPTVAPIDRQPSYPGGFAAMYAYLKANVYYPVNDTNQGTVTIGFDISERGAVVDPKVVESLDAACDAEALRVIRAMPRWTPAQSRGQWVPSHIEVPLQFKAKQPKGAPEKIN